MKIYIDICNKYPEVDLLSAAFTCRGKHSDFRCFSKKDWLKWLIAEHTPIETIQLCLRFEDMDKSAIAQFVRHTDKHPRHFVQSSRPDLNGGKPRDPNALIMYTAFYNPQALILMMRKRLCACAEKKTRQIAALVKKQLMLSAEPLLQAVGEVCVPNCVYRSGCPEPWSKCQFFKCQELMHEAEILKRYEKYNEHFWDVMEGIQEGNFS